MNTWSEHLVSTERAFGCGLLSGSELLFYRNIVAIINDCAQFYLVSSFLQINLSCHQVMAVPQGYLRYQMTCQ